MLLNCGVGEDSWESLGIQDQTSPSKRKSVLNILWKDWYWSWNCNSLVTWCEDLTHWKRPWCLERLKAGGKGDEMVGWHHRCNGHEFEQALGIGDGQGSLACCGPWGHKDSDTTQQQLNWSEVAKLRLRCFSFPCLYFWLQWIFVAVCRLSLVAVSSGHSVFRVLGLLVAVASCCGVQALVQSESFLICVGQDKVLTYVLHKQKTCIYSIKSLNNRS